MQKQPYPFSYRFLRSCLPNLGSSSRNSNLLHRLKAIQLFGLIFFFALPITKGVDLNTYDSLSSTHPYPSNYEIKTIRIGDYITLLRAAASSDDRYQLYNPQMGSDPTIGSITQEQQPDGSFSYTTTPKEETLSLDYLNRYQKEYFLNWFSNGAPTSFTSDEEKERVLTQGIYQVRSGGDQKDLPITNPSYLLEEDYNEPNAPLSLENSSNPSSFLIFNGEENNDSHPLFLGTAQEEKQKHWWTIPEDFGEACVWSMGIYLVSGFATPWIKMYMVEPGIEQASYMVGDEEAFSRNATTVMCNFNQNTVLPMQNMSSTQAQSFLSDPLGAEKLQLQPLSNEERVTLPSYSQDNTPQENTSNTTNLEGPFGFEMLNYLGTSPNPNAHDSQEEMHLNLQAQHQLSQKNPNKLAAAQLHHSLATGGPLSNSTEATASLEKWTHTYTALMHAYYHHTLKEYAQDYQEKRWFDLVRYYIPCLTTRKERWLQLEEMRQKIKILHEWSPNILTEGYTKPNILEEEDLFKLAKYYALSHKLTKEYKRYHARYFTQLGNIVNQRMLVFAAKTELKEKLQSENPELTIEPQPNSYADQANQAYEKSYETLQAAEEDLLAGKQKKSTNDYSLALHYRRYAEKLEKLIPFEQFRQNTKTEIAPNSRISYWSYFAFWNRWNQPTNRALLLNTTYKEQHDLLLQEADHYFEIYIIPALAGISGSTSYLPPTGSEASKGKSSHQENRELHLATEIAIDATDPNLFSPN